MATEVLDMEVGPASDYQKGLRYLSVGRRLNVAARQLDDGDANAVRKQADIISAKGLAFLKNAVKPARGGGGAPPASMPPAP